jgi:hypothetical protein
MRPPLLADPEAQQLSATGTNQAPGPGKSAQFGKPELPGRVQTGHTRAKLFIFRDKHGGNILE